MSEKTIDDISHEISQQFEGFRKFLDRRISEMSAEISASVEFMEINDGHVQKKLSSVHELLDQVASDTKNNSLSNGGLELKFISHVTETAVNKILDMTDKMFDLYRKSCSQSPVSPEDFSAFEQHVADIYSVCSFQDLVGQRVTRVNKHLKDIDSAIALVMETASMSGKEEKSVTPVASIKIQPKMEVSAEFNQNDINKLFED